MVFGVAARKPLVAAGEDFSIRLDGEGVDVESKLRFEGVRHAGRVKTGDPVADGRVDLRDGASREALAVRLKSERVDGTVGNDIRGRSRAVRTPPQRGAETGAAKDLP